MFGDNKSNTPLPVYDDQNLFQYPVNATSHQLQLFGNNALNYFGAAETNPNLWQHNRSGFETEAIANQQKLQISLNNTINNHAETTHQIANIPNRNHVSTGLRLSYDDEERNSTVTSGSGSMTTDSSVFFSLSDNLRIELDRQKDEVDQYLKTQEEKLLTGIRDMEKRQINSLLNTIELTVSKKLHDKDLELQAMHSQTRELAERTKQVANEAQQWCYRAKYNESVVNILKANLQEAMQQQAAKNQGKEEGYGDSDADSCVDPINNNNYLNGPGGSGSSGKSGSMVCRSCKEKEVSILLMPCRHLCLCKDCEGVFNVCPVCHMITSHTVPVYLC